MGAGKLVALTKSFSKEERINDFQVIVICGNNEKIYNKLVKKYKDNHAFVIMGHTNQMPILMKASDIVYTKPGGLTSTETVASRKPMIIIQYQDVKMPIVIFLYHIIWHYQLILQMN